MSKLPITEIKVQEEIVILNEFSNQTNGLELISLLQQELVLRTKKYEYYRDPLLNSIYYPFTLRYTYI